VQGLADYALFSAGGRVTAHSPLFNKGYLPWHFRLRQTLAYQIPQVFSQPLLPGAGQVHISWSVVVRLARAVADFEFDGTTGE